MPLPLASALRLAAEEGFTAVVLAAHAERPAADLDALADSGLLVAGAWLGGGLPPNCTLDAADVSRRRSALDVLRRQVADAARLGSTFVFLPPPTDAGEVARTCFVEACGVLAAHAAGRMVRLCLGHATTGALPTAAAALALLEAIPSASLLLDVRESLRAGEDPGGLLRRSADRVGCVLLPAEYNELAGRLRAAPYDGPLVLRPAVP
jgi:sugar phosphate isomerase/epimerase